MFAALLLAFLQAPADPFEKWEKAIVAIEKRLKEKPPAKGGVAFVGSSSIVKWNLDKSFPGKDYTNVGFGGSVIRDSTHFIDRIVVPIEPSAIVFYAGDNDLGAKRTPEQVLEDYQAFVKAVHAKFPKTKIHYIPVKPSIARWKLYDVQKVANAKVKEFAAKDERLSYVDIVPAMLGADGMPIPDLFVKDGLHMSDKGYEVWTGPVMKALAK